MPNTFATVADRLPAEDGDVRQECRNLRGYVYQLAEALRYTLSNLETSNFNDRDLADYTESVQAPVYQAVILAAEQAANDLSGAMDVVAATYATQNSLSSAVAVMQTNLDGAMATVAATYLTIDDAGNTYVSQAGFNGYADSWGAQATLFASVMDTATGTVNWAGIVAAANSYGSSLQLSADYIDLDGIIRVHDTLMLGDGEPDEWGLKKSATLEFGQVGNLYAYDSGGFGYLDVNIAYVKGESAAWYFPYPSSVYFMSGPTTYRSLQDELDDIWDAINNI